MWIFYLRSTKTPLTHLDIPLFQGWNQWQQPLAQYLDKCVTPLLVNTKSFIWDTSDFLNKINEIVTWFHPTSLDVSSLYTTIPHELGIEACRRFLVQSDCYNDRQIVFLLELLRIVLEENYFLFKETHYLQFKEAAMGSNVAPPYANSFMNMIET